MKLWSRGSRVIVQLRKRSQMPWRRRRLQCTRITWRGKRWILFQCRRRSLIWGYSWHPHCSKKFKNIIFYFFVNELIVLIYASSLSNFDIRKTNSVNYCPYETNEAANDYDQYIHFSWKDLMNLFCHNFSLYKIQINFKFIIFWKIFFRYKFYFSNKI